MIRCTIRCALKMSVFGMITLVFSALNQGVTPSSWLTLEPSTASAQRGLESEVSRLLQDAKSYYENLETEPMADALDQIISISGRSRYRSPSLSAMLAEAYILKGVLAFINSDNRSEAKQLFIKALETSPSARLSSDLATPDLTALFEDAQRSTSRSQRGYNQGGQAGGYNQGGQAGYNQGGQGNYNQGGYAQGRPGAQNGYNQGNAQGNGYNQGRPGAQNGYNQGGQAGYNQGRPEGQNGYNQGGQAGYNQGGSAGGYNQGAPGGYNQAGGYNSGSQGRYNQGGQAGSYNRGNQGVQGGYGQGRPGGQGQFKAPSSGPDILHTPPPQLRGGAPFPVRLRVSRFLRSQVLSAHLYYVSRGTAGNTQHLELRPSGELDFEGQVPSNFVVGDRLQYFIVLHDQGRNPVAHFKDHKNPQVVRIVGGRYLDLSGGQSSSKSSRFLSASLAVGAGTGTVESNADIERQEQNVQQGGFAISGVHLRLAADFWVTSSISVGVNTRLQFDRDPVIPAFLVGGLAQWVALDDQSSGRWTLRAGGGYGQIAHLVPVTPPQGMEGVNVSNPNMPVEGNPSTFLSLAGPVFYQLGTGYSLQLSDFFALTFTVDFMHFIALNSPPVSPDGSLQGCPIGAECDYPSKHFDVSVGFEFTL